MLREARKVRVHLKSGPTLEGLLIGRRPKAGHYELEAPRALESEDRTHSLDGRVLIPADNVHFFQVIH